MIYFQLLWSFFQIGLFSIGGGYAALPLIQGQVIETYHLLKMSEFVDVVTISQMTPGPIAINAATFVGTRVAGLPGAVVATIGCVLPSCIIVMILAHVYMKYRELTLVQGILGGLRPAVVALIASAGMAILMMTLFPSGEISLPALDVVSAILFLLCFIVLRKWKPNPIFVMLAAGGIGLIVFWLL